MPGTPDSSSKFDRPVFRGLLATIAICLLLQAWLAVTMEINWDEFFYLSHIYDHQRGDMTKALQSLHVHLLRWVTYVPGNEIDQVIAGRFVMLAFLAGTCVLIFKLARNFFGPPASLIAVLAFASAGPTIVHGASFRADPMAAFFIMLSLVTVARGASIRAMLLAGISASVAAMITVKVGLYAPAFLGIAAWRLRDKKQRIATFRWLAGTAVVTLVGFAALYSMQLALIAKASHAGSQAMLGDAALFTLLNPRWGAVGSALSLATVQAICIAIGAFGALIALAFGRGEDRFRLLAILGCGATLMSLLFYRNAYPYFFPFILPPAMLLIAWIVDRFATLRRPLWLGIAAAAFLIPALMVGATWLSLRDRSPQREVFDQLHRIFPRPVPMIDEFHTASSFPKRGFFMSSWGIERYRQGRPIFAAILGRETIPLLLIDGPALAIAVDADDRPRAAGQPLFDDDAEVLRDNYIEHWGPIRVAGKRFDPAVSGKFEIVIPGSYRLEGQPVAIDGKGVPGGSVISLARGAHRIEVADRSSRTLRWAGAGSPPSTPAPEANLYSPFFGWAATPQQRLPGPARP